MKVHWIAFVCVALAAGSAFAGDETKPAQPAPEAAPPAKAEEKSPPKVEEKVSIQTDREKASYFIGINIGKNLKAQGIDPDLKAFLKGLQDALAGAKPIISEKELRDALMAYQKETSARQADRSKVIGEKNQKEGEAFLAENAKKPGVTTLPSGLQYKVITAGTGPKPKTTDTVVTHYRGTLIDGTEFDSSYSRGQPATFQVGGVIKGWTEALQLMTVGSKWQLFIPSGLAYGPRGAGADIGPNATLIFEVELLEIKS